MFYGRLKVRPPMVLLCGYAAVYCMFAQPAGACLSQAAPSLPEQRCKAANSIVPPARQHA